MDYSCFGSQSCSDFPPSLAPLFCDFLLWVWWLDSVPRPYLQFVGSSRSQKRKKKSPNLCACWTWIFGYRRISRCGRPLLSSTFGFLPLIFLPQIRRTSGFRFSARFMDMVIQLIQDSWLRKLGVFPSWAGVPLRLRRRRDG
jgi:hypothetical protein